MPVFLRYRSRLVNSMREECWDEGGRSKDANGSYIGGGYFRVWRHGARYSDAQESIGVPGVPAWNYPNCHIRAGDPDRFQFDYTWNGPWVGVSQYGNPIFDAANYGATAWNRMRPDRPDMSILNAIFETREVPSSLKPRILKYRDSKAWSDYFLAVNFGWLPLLKDVQDFVSTTINLKRRLDQLERDEGKGVVRSIKLPSGYSGISRSTRGQSYSAFQLGVVTQTYNSVPTYIDTLSTGKEVWAKAKFRYWLPPGPRDWRWRARQIASIYGAYPSPAVVWNAIPWTWLADWFTNVGDILENIDFTVADRLAADYAFVMQRKFENFERTSTGNFKTVSGGSVNVTAKTVLYNESKERSIIDPFGPSINSGNLSIRQAAILGALGHTKLPSSKGGYLNRF